METYYDLNGVPDGARFTDLIPANRDPTAAASATPTAAALPAEFLRPYRGYQNIRVRGNLAEDPGNLSFAFNRPLDFFYSELAQSNRHSLVINYSWDIPGRHTG